MTVASEPIHPSVLLVEPSAETREVLATALQLRGLRIIEADEPHRGLQMAQAERPDVIVLDVDQPAVDDRLQQDLSRATRHPHAGLIVLANSRPQSPTANNRFIAKPFHYGPLVQTIERLLSHSKAA